MSRPYPLRQVVRNFTPYSPGLSIDEIKTRYNLANVIKMASNENPLGASPLVQQRIMEHAGLVFRYTQSGTPKLARAVATFFNVPEECIVLGNGSDEVIDLLIRSCPTPGEHNVVTCKPCFSLYTLQSRFCDVALREVPLNTDFSFDWEKLRATVDEKTALVFLTTPDNPSGYCPPVDEVRAFAQSLPPSCLLVIDEAYMDFCDNESYHSLFTVRDTFPNIVFLRTFSKSFGLAGLRLGFGVMQPSLARALCSVRPPFSVNILAEAAGIAALEDTVFREETISVVKQGRTFLAQELDSMGCHVYPTQANFLLFKLPENCILSAVDVFNAMLQRGVIIRPLTSYGLPDCLRVTVGTMQENQIFTSQLRTVVLS